MRKNAIDELQVDDDVLANRPIEKDDRVTDDDDPRINEPVISRVTSIAGPNTEEPGLHCIPRCHYHSTRFNNNHILHAHVKQKGQKKHAEKEPVQPPRAVDQEDACTHIEKLTVFCLPGTTTGS
jgi:hypothetical protein